MDEAEARRHVLQRGWLSQQPPDFTAQVLDACRLQHRDAGEFVIRFGDSPSGLYGIADGAIGLHVPNAEGSTSLASIAWRGDWIGQTAVVSGRPSAVSYSVIEPVVLLYLPMARATEIAARRIEWTRALFSVSGIASENLIANVGSLLVRNPARRIAASLLRVAPARASGSAVAPVRMTLTQTQLGEIANAARDVVNRALKRFEGQGWISVGYGTLTILDPDGLAAFVETGD
jgi:CRP/FNR family transcriptional regulator, cyclic AMP receptor protein